MRTQPPAGRLRASRTPPQPVWVFDLDDTLHDASAGTFPLLHREIEAYLARHLNLAPAAANALRQRYWKQYGATLRGLMRHHAVDPHHFLRETHPLAPLAEHLVHDRGVPRLLARLPGIKLIFSNAPVHYVREILRLMKIERHFAGIFAIEHCRWRPKPDGIGYRRILYHLRLPAGRCIMVDDSLANLKTARKLGMRTIWISARSGRPAWVDGRLRSVQALPRYLRRTRSLET